MYNGSNANVVFERKERGRRQEGGVGDGEETVLETGEKSIFILHLSALKLLALRQAWRLHYFNSRVPAAPWNLALGVWVATQVASLLCHSQKAPGTPEEQSLPRQHWLSLSLSTSLLITYG